MAELFVLAIVALGVLAALGLLAAVLSLVGWVIALPFKLLAFAFKGIAVLLALPFLILMALLGFGLFGAGVLVFALPAIPFLIIALLIWALFRTRDPEPRAPRSGTTEPAA